MRKSKSGSHARERTIRSDPSAALRKSMMCPGCRRRSVARHNAPFETRFPPSWVRLTASRTLLAATISPRIMPTSPTCEKIGAARLGHSAAGQDLLRDPPPGQRTYDPIALSPIFLPAPRRPTGRARRSLHTHCMSNLTTKSHTPRTEIWRRRSSSRRAKMNATNNSSEPCHVWSYACNARSLASAVRNPISSVQPAPRFTRIM